MSASTRSRNVCSRKAASVSAGSSSSRPATENRSSCENRPRGVRSSELRVPEPPVQAGQLGKLRGEVRSRMERRHGKVAPDEAEAVEAVQERLHRSTGLEAVRASEIPVLDERQLGAARAGDVITLSDRGHGAYGRGGHPTRVLSASIATISSGRTMVANTSLNASVELARAIASMRTSLRTDPVIASGLGDQRYAVGDWRSGPPRR